MIKSAMNRNVMKKMLFAILVFLPGFAFAAGAETPIELDAMEPDLEDHASLQRGAKTYLNYCMACHSLKYQRYQRTADDLGIPVDLMMEHMVFDSSAQIGSLMDNAMSVDNAKQWFGSVPPDLTMYAMLKGGPEYLYTYMRVFYEDKTRPMGVNNLLFENVAMPHPLIELQGLQRKVCKQIPRLAENGGEMRDPLTGEPITEEQCGNDLLDRGFSPLELVEGTGSLTPEEYDQVIYDLANFLYYTVDPSRLDRERIGIYVLLFLAFFFVFTWLLGREYTKEFH
jgi:ubiquinol-cytochrome c reductase cytochrome b subunit